MVCVALQETSWTAPPEVKAVLGKKAQVYHICLCSPLRFTLFDGLDAWLECPASHRDSLLYCNLWLPNASVRNVCYGLWLFRGSVLTAAAWEHNRHLVSSCSSLGSCSGHPNCSRYERLKVHLTDRTPCFSGALREETGSA